MQKTEISEQDRLYPESFQQLTELLRGLPGVGRRSAERMALQFCRWDDSRLKKLGTLLTELKERIGKCPVCGAMSEGKGVPCSICSSPKRDSSVICVVEDFSQLKTMESGGSYRGLYHVLGGKLAPLEGKTAETLSIEPLLKRLDAGGVQEVILALSPDVSGQATAVYLAGFLRQRGITVTRLAQGLPAGSDLTYADPATIAAALAGRRTF